MKKLVFSLITLFSLIVSADTSSQQNCIYHSLAYADKDRAIANQVMGVVAKTLNIEVDRVDRKPLYQLVGCRYMPKPTSGIKILRINESTSL